jgi:putative ABC transport system permease protein
MMPRRGRIALIWRLAIRDLQHRRAEAALMLIVIAAAAATLTLGLVLTGVTSSPYLHTRALTSGPDVTAQSGNPVPAAASGPPASLTALEHAPGVIGHSGPYPVVFPVLRTASHNVPTGFTAEGRDRSRASLDQPRVTQGRWVRPGGVVVEVTYARELGVSLGDRITLDGRPFRIVGLAVSTAWPAVNAPGLIWLTRADTESLATRADPLGYTLNLKLANPARATAFANARGTSNLWLSSWQQIGAQDARQLDIEQEVLVIGSWILGLLAIASIAVLVGGRMAEQTRRVGLLKAVGGTPKLVAAVLLAEHLMLALLAAAAGLGIGWLAAPLLSSPADGLIGTASPPTVTLLTVGVVAAAALLVALLATFFPAIRAARTSTVAALADAPRAPRRRKMLIAASRRLPVPMLLGLRLAGRRPRRSVLSTASITITVAMVVAAVALFDRSRTHKVPGGLVNPIQSGIREVLLVITVVLVILAAVNSIFVAWVTVLDARRPLAVARSLGATQRQVSAGVSVTQLVSALPGAVLGIPVGIGLVAATSRGGALPIPSGWTLAAVVIGAAAVVALLAAAPARIGARRSPAEILLSERA